MQRIEYRMPAIIDYGYLDGHTQKPWEIMVVCFMLVCFLPPEKTHMAMSKNLPVGTPSNRLNFCQSGNPRQSLGGTPCAAPFMVFLSVPSGSTNFRPGAMVAASKQKGFETRGVCVLYISIDICIQIYKLYMICWSTMSMLYIMYITTYIHIYIYKYIIHILIKYTFIGWWMNNERNRHWKTTSTTQHNMTVHRWLQRVGTQEMFAIKMQCHNRMIQFNSLISNTQPCCWMNSTSITQYMDALELSCSSRLSKKKTQTFLVPLMRYHVDP